MSAANDQRKRGVPKGYKRSTGFERLLAVLRVEAGEPMEVVAEDFQVSIATGVEVWIDQWRTRRHHRGHEELTAYEESAGYVLTSTMEDWNGREHEVYNVERGPQWSRKRVRGAIEDLAAYCFGDAVANASPTASSLAAIGRSYRSLSPDKQALYSPVWDLCQMAIDEIEMGHVKLTRACQLVTTMEATS